MAENKFHGTDDKLVGRNPLCQCHFRMFTNVLNVYVFLGFALGDLDGMSFAGALLPGFSLANFFAAKFCFILSLLLFPFSVTPTLDE